MGVLEDLGVHPIINAQGTLTELGGSLMHPDVLAAMCEAAIAFVDLEELHRRAGDRIAQLLGVEAACVTAGAAAGLTIAAAALMAGDRLDAILALPDTGGLRDQVVVLKSHRIRYDQAVRLSGARFVEVGVTSWTGIEQVAGAITERTAGLFFSAEAAGLRGSLPLRDLAALARARGVPVLVDAAAELPPASNISRYLDEGADLVVFSGGKEIGGPQSSGFVVGSAELIGFCRANAFPHYGVGRGMKTDKETVAGLIKAVELWVARDYDAIFREWQRIVDAVVEGVARLPDVKAERGYPTEPGTQPAVIPRAYLSHRTRPAVELRSALLRHQPAIAVGVENGRLAINPQCLARAEVPLVVNALVGVLSA